MVGVPFFQVQTSKNVRLKSVPRSTWVAYLKARMVFLDALQADTWTFKNHGFVTDTHPYASKSNSDCIPREFLVADYLAGPKSSHRIKNGPTYLGTWVRVGRILQMLRFFSGMIRDGPPGPGTNIWGFRGPILTCKLTSVFPSPVGPFFNSPNMPLA